jgi:hypothetical protein
VALALVGADTAHVVRAQQQQGKAPALLDLRGPADSAGQGAPQFDGQNTTIVPRAPPDAKSKNPAPVAGQTTFVALLTEDGQRIDQGMVWRIFEDNKGAAAGTKNKLLSVYKEASPSVKLAAGDYVVNAAFGRANLTRKISIKPGSPAVEQFVLNAGGLRMAALIGNGEPAPPNTISYDIYSDERDQFGNRSLIMRGAKPALIIRLNSGIYQIASTYGDANATVRADVTVEAGKLTEVTVAHASARVTFKLVSRAGGEALADTQWSIAMPQGEVVKESVGALPTHILAPGTYVVSARSGGRVFSRSFSVQHGQATQVEVVMQ